MMINSLLRQTWSKLDWIIRKLSRITDLRPGQGSLLRIAMRKYRGKDWLMPDGSILRAGDTYIELHINNEYLLRTIGQKTSVERAALIVLREARQDLPYLAQMLNQEKHWQQVNILMAITLLHRGTEHLGFTSYDLPRGSLRLLSKWYEGWLLGLYHPGGFKGLGSYREALLPKYIVMTKKDLLKRYLPVKQD
jgi:hypothetical protein